MQKNTKVGWVGLGVMGLPMCRHLMAGGYPVALYTRSREKAGSILDEGALWCDSPAQVASCSDVIFTMVGVEQEVREVYLSAEGLFNTSINGRIFVDMGTTAPLLTKELAALAAEKKARFIDAPVSGGDVGARNASLSIMAGGNESDINEIKELFDLLGSVRNVGEVGDGQHTKMCNQIVVASTMIGVCEALLYAKNAGLDCEKLLSAITPGAAGCWTLDNLAPRINRADFAPGFMVDHFIKDLGIAVKEARAMNISLPGLELAQSLYEKLSSMGHGKKGTQALLLALEALSSEK